MRKNAERAEFSGANGFSMYCSIHMVDNIQGRTGFQGQVTRWVQRVVVGSSRSFAEVEVFRHWLELQDWSLGKGFSPEGYHCLLFLKVPLLFRISPFASHLSTLRFFLIEGHSLNQVSSL